MLRYAWTTAGPLPDGLPPRESIWVPLLVPILLLRCARARGGLVSPFTSPSGKLGFPSSLFTAPLLSISEISRVSVLPSRSPRQAQQWEPQSRLIR